MVDKIKIETLVEKIKTFESFVINMHANPDGDTFGSALALSLILEKLGKKYTVVSPDRFPDNLNWLPGIDKTLVYVDNGKEVKKALAEADCLICVDFNAPHRTYNMTKQLNKFSNYKIMIDHHVFPDEDYFDLGFSYAEYSSTAELLFDILEKTEFNKFFDDAFAANIFVGIMTDTGSFSYSCNRPETFETAAKLIRYNIDVKKINDLIYNNNDINRLKLSGFAIDSRMKIIEEKNAAYIYLSTKDLERFDHKSGYTEGLVNIPLSIKGIEFSILLIEQGEMIKISFRSKSTFEANTFAAKYFEGGGHKNAAGGKNYDSLENTIKKLEDIIQEIEI
jgi:phosphoesterase RecJ-like protein